MHIILTYIHCRFHKLSYAINLIDDYFYFLPQPGPDGDVVPQPCKHPAFDLDIEDPILTEADIKGAALDLSNLESARIPALERWLKCRRLSIAGNRRKLIDR